MSVFGDFSNAAKQDSKIAELQSQLAKVTAQRDLFAKQLSEIADDIAGGDLKYVNNKKGEMLLSQLRYSTAIEKASK